MRGNDTGMMWMPDETPDVSPALSKGKKSRTCSSEETPSEAQSAMLEACQREALLLFLIKSATRATSSPNFAKVATKRRA